MKSRGILPYIFMTGLILCLAGILLAQSPPDRALFVNGKAAGTVTQVGGRSYVDLDTVAQITNGTFTVEPNRILLTIPVREASAIAAAAALAVPPNSLSKDFARSAITALAEMREWRGAIGTILTYGVPVVGSWPQDYHDHVQASLGQVGVAASTAGDHDALGLLRNQFENVSQWANGIVSARQAMDATNTVNPNYAANDPVLAKITSCNNFLNSMLVSGGFADNASCH
jgi:hypothetical protein